VEPLTLVKAALGQLCDMAGGFWRLLGIELDREYALAFHRHTHERFRVGGYRHRERTQSNQKRQ
jgi:hypothetical protein